MRTIISNEHNKRVSADNKVSIEDPNADVNEPSDENSDSNQNIEESEVYIPRFFVQGFFEIKEFLEEKMVEGMINDYSYINGDYFAYVKVTDDQKQQWIEYSQEEINRVVSQEYDGFSLVVSEDNKNLEMDIESTSDYYLASHTMYDALFNIQNYMVFSGMKDWACHIVVKNLDSDKNIMEADYPNEDGDISPSGWTNIEDPELAYETMISNCYSYIHYEEPYIEDGVFHSKASGIQIIIPDGAKVTTQEEMDEFNGLKDYTNRLYEIKKVIVSGTPYEEFKVELANGASIGVAVGYNFKDNENEFLDWMEKNLDSTLKTESSVKEYNLSRVESFGRNCLLQQRTDGDGKRYQYYYVRDGLYITILAEYETPEQEESIKIFINENIIKEE